MTDTSATDLSSDFSVIPPTPSSRLIGLAYGAFEYSFSVSSSLHYHASRSKDRFVSALSSGGTEPLSLTELITRYLLFVVEHEDLWLDASRGAHVDFVELLLDKIERDFLQGRDIHTVAAALPGEPEQRHLSVKSYYFATAFVRRSIGSHDSALFNAALEDRAGLYAVFGGQGNTGNYLGELRELHSTYCAFVEPVLSCASELLQSLLRQVSVTTLRQFPQGLNVMQWIQSPDSTPSADYLISAPVSFPLIGLVQFANYAVMCNVLGKSPGQLTERFRGMAGHSQGVVVAAAIAAVDSWSSFDEAVKTALTILFFIGSRGQEVSPRSTVPSTISQEAIENGDGFPTPMLNVSNCPRPRLQMFIDAVNKHLEPEQRIAIALINGRSNIVVSGPVPSLCALNANLRQVKAAVSLDQSRIPFSARKPDFTSRFLPISAAFHSDHLEEAYTLASNDLKSIRIPSRSLKTSVYHTKSGADLKNSASDNIVPDLIRMITCDLADWPKSTQFPNATHIIDFGPGATSGVGPLTHRNKEGTGVRVILMSAADGASSEFGYRSEIFDRDDRALKYGANWQKDHGSKLFRSATGELRIDNAMTRLLGLPPIMVAGMTPTTVPWDFVSAITNAGYHVELAAGGYNNAEQMLTAITKLHESIPVGRGICLNVIYANPKAIRWQIPLVRRLRSEGLPIDGLTFGAGVPSIEVANEHIESLGLRYIAFKPGSTNSIKQVISIAKANPTFPIMLQWTGGRGGGHHSFEDFHDPLIRNYGKIRSCSNIILIAGSGFGGAEDTYPYLSGEWSLAFGLPSMPFDGCLFGSRMMVAKESHTSRAAKEAIVAAKGVEDPRDWENTYKGVAGGVITVQSEMGEPIHKLATRGVLFWREMDDKIFSITDKAKRVAELQKQKQYIVKKLNDDFQKVWFGRNDLGQVVDLQDMTYAEVLRRLVELLYVKSESRWIDQSYVRLTADFVKRMQARLASKSIVSKFPKDFGLQQPFKALQEILGVFPTAEKQVITFDDARYFILLCQRPGQKPVTFVPDLDENFETWFKKDSLWQSEDLAAVVGQDAGRTCILQGPVSARYSKVADEPVGEILGQISRAHVSWLLRDRYRDDQTKVPTIDSIADNSVERETRVAHCQISQEPGKRIYSIPHTVSNDEIPDTDTWLKLLAGKPGSWRWALFTSQDIIQGTKLQPNPIRRILSPYQGLRVEVSYPDDPLRTTVAVSESTPEEPTAIKRKIEIRNEVDILVTLFADETTEGGPLPLTFKFTYHPEFVLHPIREEMAGRNDRLRKFYYRLWFGGGPMAKPTHIGRARSLKSTRRAIQVPQSATRNITLNTALSSLREELATPMELRDPAFNISSPTTAEFHGREITINSSTIHDFEESFGESDKRISSRSDKTMAPLDFAIVVGWEAMMKAIFPKVIDGEFLKLVHLSNKFRVINDAAPLSSSDRIESSAEILSIMNGESGRVVEVGAVIKRGDLPVLELTSQFLFRGIYTNFDICFQKKIEPQMKVVLDSPAQVAVLRSKSWIQFVDSHFELLGQSLIFQLQSLIRFETSTTWRSVETFGKVFVQLPSSKRHRLVATVMYSAGNSTSNPVTDYLQRHGRLITETLTLENPQHLGEQDWLRITAPASNQAYARASGDFNPIHVSRTFAKYANLPGPITHGMYTSAAIRQLVERAACSSEDVRMKSYHASFVGMVLPGDVLEVQVMHVAIKEGLRVLSFEARNVATGEKVLVGEAEVDQPLTAYVFTGQGSQQPGMGMDLYATSEVAREVWEQADRYFSETYGKQNQCDARRKMLISNHEQASSSVKLLSKTRKSLQSTSAAAVVKRSDKTTWIWL
jgi:fatty acid synthase subunit beta, fungi type